MSTFMPLALYPNILFYRFSFLSLHKSQHLSNFHFSGLSESGDLNSVSSRWGGLLVNLSTQHHTVELSALIYTLLEMMDRRSVRKPGLGPFRTGEMERARLALMEMSGRRCMEWYWENNKHSSTVNRMSEWSNCMLGFYEHRDMLSKVVVFLW